MILNQVNGTTSKTFTIGKNGINIDATDVSNVSFKKKNGTMTKLNCENIPDYEIDLTVPCQYNFPKHTMTYAKFDGQIIRDGTPTPSAPVKIKGVKNPWKSAYYGEEIPIVKEGIPVNPNVAPLIKLTDGVCDRIACKNGTWGIVRRVGKITFNGTETWHQITSSGGTPIFYADIPLSVQTPSSDLSNAICSRGSVYSSDSLYVNETYGFAIAWHANNFPIPELFVSIQEITTMDAWKAKLVEWNTAGKPLEVYYELKDPVFEGIVGWDIYPYVDPIEVNTYVVPGQPPFYEPSEIIGTTCETTAYTYDPLTRVANGTQDNIILHNNTWGIERNIVKFTLSGTSTDGTYAYQEDRANHGYFQLWVNLPIHHNSRYSDGLLCTHLPCINDSDFYKDEDFICYFPHLRMIGISFPKNLLTGWSDSWTFEQKVTALTSWIKHQYDIGTPIQIYYITHSPDFEPIPEWNNFGKVKPFNVYVSIVTADPSLPLSPTNIGNIRRDRPIMTTGYLGQTKQVMGELFHSDTFDKVNMSHKWCRYEVTGNEPFVVWQGVVGMHYLPVDPLSESQPCYCTHSESVMTVKFDDGMGVNFGLTTEVANDWQNFVRSQKSMGTPVTIYYKVKEPYYTRHNFSLNLSPDIDYTMETGDSNSLLQNIKVTGKLDSDFYGNLIYTCSHTKSGNTHLITGKSNAREIEFVSSGDSSSDDVWKYNDVPIVPTYYSGESILPNSIVKGDFIRGVLESESVKHIDGMIMPGENLLEDWNFRNFINNNAREPGKWGITGMAGCSAEVQDDGILLTSPAQYGAYLYQVINPNNVKLLTGKTVCFSCFCEGNSALVNASIYFDNVYSAATANYNGLAYSVITVPKNTKEIMFQFGANAAGTCKIKAAKLEIGSSFTGWNEPKFDALRMFKDKPTPQSNLLDNAIFDSSHIVNQQKITSGTENGLYPCDRWLFFTTNGLFNVNADCIEVIRNPGAEHTSIAQRIPLSILSPLTTYTLAVQFKDNTPPTSLVFHRYDISVAVMKEPITLDSHNCCYWTFTMPSELGTEYMSLNIYVNDNSSYRIQRVKLEPGPRFTGWDEPKFDETLISCQRYLETVFEPYTDYSYPIIEVGDNPNQIEVYMNYDYKVKKRTKPNIVIQKSPLSPYGRLVVRKVDGTLLKFIDVSNIAFFSQDQERTGIMTVINEPIPEGTHWITYDTLNTDMRVLASTGEGVATYKLTGETTIPVQI